MRGIKGRHDQLDSGKGRQPHRVVEESAGSQFGGFGHEFAVLEEHADDRFAHDHQANRGRYGDERNDAQRKG